MDTRKGTMFFMVLMVLLIIGSIPLIVLKLGPEWLWGIVIGVSSMCLLNNYKYLKELKK